MLQNPIISNRSQETLFFVPPGDQNVTQFSCCTPVHVSNLNTVVLMMVPGMIFYYHKESTKIIYLLKIGMIAVNKLYITTVNPLEITDLLQKKNKCKRDKHTYHRVC